MQVIALAAAIDGGFASIVPQLQVLCEAGPFVGGFHAIAFSATVNAKVLTLPSDLGFLLCSKASTPVVGFITQHFFHYKRRASKGRNSGNV